MALKNGLTKSKVQEVLLVVNFKSVKQCRRPWRNWGTLSVLKWKSCTYGFIPWAQATKQTNVYRLLGLHRGLTNSSSVSIMYQPSITNWHINNKHKRVLKSHKLNMSLKQHYLWTSEYKNGKDKKTNVMEIHTVTFTLYIYINVCVCVCVSSHHQLGLGYP